jgi:aminoglycoside phosphotransferase (APT) family kinase protein
VIIEPRIADQLVEALREQRGFETARLAEPLEAMQGGFWAAIYRVHLRDVPDEHAELVLRVMPNDAAAAKELVIQRGVVAQGYSAPAIHLFGGREFGLGGPFMLMDRAPGAPLLAGLDGTKALRALSTALRDLPTTLAHAMARLHRLDPTPITVELEHAATNAAIDVDGLLTILTRAAACSNDELIRCGGKWLLEHRPPASPTVVCHGDLHPFNVLIDGDDWCVLDWTGALVADPAYDVAFTNLLLSHPPLAVPPAFKPAIVAGGRYVGRRFRSVYESLSGNSIDRTRLRWFTKWQALRIALDLDGWRRDGRLDDHAGHPWFSLEPTVRRQLESLPS